MRAGPLRALGRPALLAAMVAALLVAPSPASAHVQVSPTTAAPDDAVEFTILVPNERDQETTRVELQNPPGMLPFAFADVPGWKRDVIEAADGSIDRVVWTGRLARDGYVKFSFLAGTPEKAGDVTWKALQTYSDGVVVRWIGDPSSDTPAAVTHLATTAAKQNAGGESAAAAPSATTAPTTTSPPSSPAAATVPAAAADAAPAAATASTGDGDDPTARAVAVGALVLGLVAVIAAMISRRRTGEGPTA